MNKPSNVRRAVISLIVVLVIVQVAMLAYVWSLFRPSTPQDAAEPPPSRFQWLSGSDDATATPADTLPTLAPDAAEVVVGPLVSATDHAALSRRFDEEQALEHLAYLADDEREGRQPGTSGGLAAGDYIAARFAEYGLEPAGVNDTYFQPFTAPYGEITSLPVLTVISPDGETIARTYAYRTDYRALTGGYLGAGEGEGQVVWLNECLHDDYAGLDLDLVGKIILCRYTRDPEVYRQAIEHQVGGLLLLDREREVPFFRRGGYRETAWVPQTIPTYLISEDVAQDLLIGTDYTLDDLGLRFTATPLAATVRIAVTTKEQDEIDVRNVLALLPGSDPERRDEIVVVGAHYDHIGREPDGVVMNGANDNASGTATVLEIARLWHAQGFVPARSVLFAAWDAEEVGLLGAYHYVRNPTYPLTRTVAMLNLDMVGRGDELEIDGVGDVAIQLQASAQAYGITSTIGFFGRSDHVPFFDSGIPAAMPTWSHDAYYHTPDDTVETIEPERLKAAGVLSAHTLASLAEGYVELEQAVERLRASIATGDREAFLEGLDPTDADLRATQAAWFDNLWSRELSSVSVRPGQMRVGNGEANVTLQLVYRWADAARNEVPVSYDARFVQRDGTWTYAGYDLSVLAGDVITIAHFADVPVEASQLLSTTQQAYLTLAADLGLEPITGTRIIYYPNAATMRTIARPAADRDTRWLVSSAGLAEIAWGEPITPALVNLALNQMGLPPRRGNGPNGTLPRRGNGPDGTLLHKDEGAWLREGLARHYEGGAEREYLPVLVAADVFTALLDFPILSSLPDREARMLRAYAWSATEYLLDRYGADGLRALCAAWGRGDPDDAFQESLGLSSDRFEAAWRADRLAPLRADADGIQATIAARVEAVHSGDSSDFLSTVTLADPTLRAEERNWFAGLTNYTFITYSVTGGLVGWSPGEDEAIVVLSVESAITDVQSSRVNYNARFVRSARGDRWLYAGVAWNELVSEHFILKYQYHDDAWARHVLDLAETVYAQVTADLDMTPSLPQQIKVYDDGGLFRDWGPGESIKLWLQEDIDRSIQNGIAQGLTRQMFFARGLELAWLYEGVAIFETDRLQPLGAHWGAGQRQPIVQNAVRRHQELSLDDLLFFEELPEDQMELAYAQSWSLVSYIVKQHGLPGLRQFIARSIASNDTAANLRAALGVDLGSFLDEWREYTRVAGMPDGLVSMAQRFDAERALVHVVALSSPEFGGREAGSPGADLAANYIAEQFAAVGLQPLGDPLTPTVVVTGTVMVTGELDYLQQFPISYTHLISIPTFTLLGDDGAALYEFVYRENFIESTGSGVIQRELVWMPADDLEGVGFGGAVVLDRGVDDLVARAAQVQDHGASGLIVVTDREIGSRQIGQLRRSGGRESQITIPVFEITESSLEILLERLGMERRDLMASSYALPFPRGVQVRQTLVRTPITTTLTANVLGLLPGSDPDLADEVLLIGAHYDHVGQAPDGLLFPGANQNASGVAALLEMARVMQSAGYQPARSVLFVAWGAEEADRAGVDYYLIDPTISLTQTVGAIALDSIAVGRGFKLLFYGMPEHDQPLIHHIEASADELDRRTWRRGSTGEGWHVSFNQSGIPTLKLIWDGAEDSFYSPDDTADTIDLERLANSGEILTLTVSWLASQ